MKQEWLSWKKNLYKKKPPRPRDSFSVEDGLHTLLLETLLQGWRYFSPDILPSPELKLFRNTGTVQDDPVRQDFDVFDTIQCIEYFAKFLTFVCCYFILEIHNQQVWATCCWKQRPAPVAYFRLNRRNVRSRSIPEGTFSDFETLSRYC